MNYLKSTLAGGAGLPTILRTLLLGLAVLSGLFTSGTAEAQGYGVQPGDQLRIEVLEDPSLNRTVLVAPDGRISLPQAGSLRASGRTVEAIQSDLTGRLAGAFASPPNVYVSLAQIAPRDPGPASVPRSGAGDRRLRGGRSQQVRPDRGCP